MKQANLKVAKGNDILGKDFVTLVILKTFEKGDCLSYCY